MVADCKERDELERLIRASLSEIQKSANLGVEIAASRPPSAQDLESFRELRDKNQIITGRLFGLREALRIHRSIHGC